VADFKRIGDIALPAMDDGCSYDDGVRCPEKATDHFIVTDLAHLPVTAAPGDSFTIAACKKHFDIAYGYCYDWHPIGPCCDVPGSLWRSTETQGEGCCIWPDAEIVALEQALELEPELQHG
jgi:hypothetical protein